MGRCGIILHSVVALFLVISFFQIKAKTADAEVVKNYEIIEEKMLNDALIISVATSDPLEELSQDDLKEISKSLVQQNKNRYMVRVFFYDKDEKPGKDIAQCRFEWTKAQGLKLSYDRINRKKKKA